MKKAILCGLLGVVVGVFAAYAAGDITSKVIGSVSDLSKCTARVILISSDNGTHTMLETTDKLGINRVTVFLDTKNLNDLIDYLKQASWKMPAQ